MKKILSLLAVSFIYSFSLNAQDCTRPFISEYIEGTGNNKALELYNPTNQSFSLTGYKILRFSNGSQAPTEQIILTATIPAYGTFVIVNGQTITEGTSPACNPELQAKADMLDAAYPAVCYFNGDDALALVKSGSGDINDIQEFVDIFGKIGQRPQTAWTNVFPFDGSVRGKWITANLTLVRKPSIKAGVTQNPEYFDALSQWDTLSVDTWTELKKHTCDCQTASRGKNLNGANSAFQVNIFPNPLNAETQFLNIRSQAYIQSIEIFELSGKRIAQRTFTLPQTQAEISIEGIRPGVYFLRIYNAQKQATTEKIIIHN
jgi:hypothetical protein